MKNRLLPYFVLIMALSIAVPVLAQDKPTEKKCLECHTKTNAKTFVHEPSKESCKNCHESNGKKHPLEDEEGFKLVEKVPQLCYTCHDPINTKKHLHPPVKQGDCLDCHEIHSSNEKKLIFLAPPDLCFSCHSDLEKRMETDTVMHKIAKTGVACLNCHSPHQSDQPRMLLASEKDLCLKCHNKPIKKDQRVISNIKNDLEKNKIAHSAIEINGCTGCHDPHASAKNSLLKGAFTTSNYISNKSKDKISLCFQCHDPSLLEKEIKASTGFRNGDKNLHFKHVNKVKGRNCVNCHGIHSAPNEFLLVDNVKFGNWDMPLKYTKSETGGKCVTACHAPRTYSRAPSK
jgi:predicted CXXCH cytochrome family protein